MSIAEGTGTDANQQPEEVENKMQAPPEYGQQQPQLQTVIVVPTNVQQTVQQTVQTTTYATSDNKNTAAFGVSGSVAMNNLGYFQMREDTGSYEESMKPWEIDGMQNYSFAVCTEFTEEFKRKQKRNKQQENKYKVNTVFHKTNAPRLVIKRKDKTSSLEAAKNNPMTMWALGVCFLGILLIIVGVYTEAYIIAAGVVMIVVAFVLFFCFQKRKSLREDQDIITQSIPIRSIFYAERTVSQTQVEQQCCCATPEDTGVKYSFISIGYNRSNISSKFQNGASTEDFIKIQLISNQAYNLHQYINTILDGTHPQINGNDDFLPR